MSKPDTAAGAQPGLAALPTNILDAAIASAALRDPALIAEDGREWLILPDRFTATDITDPHRRPRQPRTTVEVDDRDSLQNYTRRHMNPDHSALFGNFDNGTITARLDWHPHNQAGSFGESGVLAHSCRLTLRKSEEFRRWDEFEDTLHSQADFARFLEENASDICDPHPADMIEISRDLEAVSGQTFKASTRLENGDRAFTFETESKIISRVQAPSMFALSIPIYQGEEPEVLQARFRWRALPTGLVLGFQWHRVEYMRQARFLQILTAAAEATGLPAYLGRQSA